MKGGYRPFLRWARRLSMVKVKGSELRNERLEGSSNALQEILWVDLQLKVTCCVTDVTLDRDGWWLILPRHSETIMMRGNNIFLLFVTYYVYTHTVHIVARRRQSKYKHIFTLSNLILSSWRYDSRRLSIQECSNILHRLLPEDLS